MIKGLLHIFFIACICFGITSFMTKQRQKHTFDMVSNKYKEIYDRLEIACQDEIPFSLRGKVYACFEVKNKCEVQDD